MGRSGEFNVLLSGKAFLSLDLRFEKESVQKKEKEKEY
jgi:hypothetical protein